MTQVTSTGLGIGFPDDVGHRELLSPQVSFHLDMDIHIIKEDELVSFSSRSEVATLLNWH